MIKKINNRRNKFTKALTIFWPLKLFIIRLMKKFTDHVKKLTLNSQIIDKSLGLK